MVFPQYDVLRTAADVAEFARGADSLGFRHILVYDHVVGVDPAVHPDWTHIYRRDSEFHEPFVLFGYLAAICAMELVSGVLVLPQRQTALVAKQAAEADWLSGGRLRLGVGLAGTSTSTARSASRSPNGGGALRKRFGRGRAARPVPERTT